MKLRRILEYKIQKKTGNVLENTIFGLVSEIADLNFASHNTYLVGWRR